MKQVLCMLCMSALLFACNGKPEGESQYNFSSDPLLYSKTVKNLNNIVLENNFPPMIAARNYAYANIAAYECIAAGDSAWASLAGQIKHMPVMPLASSSDIDYSLAALLAFVKVGNAVTFPEGSMMAYHEDLLKMADSLGLGSGRIENSRLFADSIASAVLNWSKGDHYNATRGAARFSVTEQPGRWVPTPPMYATALEPHWMEIRPFIMDSASQFKPVPPPAYDVNNKRSVYYLAMMEVKNVSDSLTEEQKHIADFWDDNPFKMNVTGHVMFATKKFSPAGHWMNITGIGAQKAGADFNTTVASYAETSIALFDAFISCWDEKYRSNYIRPETVINNLVSQDWRPYIQTPPFPSYTSGHSTISAAAAEVMTEFFGEKLAFTDTSLLEFGIANREIKSFRDAAQEASISRLYGGIHYRFDLDAGNTSGRKLGEHIVATLHLRRKP